jgi:hypothetical protein
MFFNLRIQCINTEILITEMGVSDEAKNVIPLKFLHKIKNQFFFPLGNSIRGHTVYIYYIKKSVCLRLHDRSENFYDVRN